jgi:hypothetical protein
MALVLEVAVVFTKGNGLALLVQPFAEHLFIAPMHGFLGTYGSELLARRIRVDRRASVAAD